MTTNSRQTNAYVAIANAAFCCIVAFNYAAEPRLDGWQWLYWASVVIATLSVWTVFCAHSMATYFVLSYFGLYYLLPVASYIGTGEFAPRREELVQLTNYLCISSLHVFLSSYAIVAKRDIAAPVTLLSKRRLHVTSLALFSILLLSAAWMIQSAGGLTTADLTRIDLKYVGGGKIYALWLMYFSSISVFLFTVYLRKSSGSFFSWMLFIALLALAEAAFFLALRSRTTVIMHAISIAIGLQAARMYAFSPTIPVRRYVGQANIIPFWKLCALLGGLGALAIFLRFFRGIAFSADGNGQYDLMLMTSRTLEGGDLGYLPVAMDAIDYVMRAGMWLDGQSYYRLLFSFLPDGILGDKPLETQIIIGRALTGLEVMTIPPSVFGDAYINFKHWGLSVFALYGMVFAMIDRLAPNFYRIALFALTFPVVFHFVRGAFVNPIVIFVLLFASLVVVRILVARVEPKRAQSRVRAEEGTARL